MGVQLYRVTFQKGTKLFTRDRLAHGVIQAIELAKRDIQRRQPDAQFKSIERVDLNPEKETRND